ncbi:hypothetical protein ACWD6P_14760 [Streptomyces sp. NPDC002446]
MPIRTSRRLLAVTAVAFALTCTVVVAPAQADPAATRGVPISRPVLVVSQTTDNYLLPDNTTGKPDTYLQVYANEAPTWSKNWRLDRVGGTSSDPIFTFKSDPAGGCAQARDGVDTAIDVKTCASGNKNQWWHLRAVRGTDPNDPDVAIVPDRNEQLAITSAGHGDAMVYLRRMWGGEPSRAQGWRFYPAV